MNTYSIKLSLNEQENLKQFFKNYNNVTFDSLPYANFRVKGEGFVAVLYNSGKLVLQGSDVSELASKIEADVLKKAVTATNKETIDNTGFVAHIGVDESGKGDYFGPLIIAGAYVDETNYQKFIDLGIKDSKQLTDITIRKLAIEIKNSAIFSVVTINPEKYNELYASFKNLNKLLAWGHARVIENILEKQQAKYALCDKFGDEKLIQNALMDRGKQIELRQMTKAESDIAVACASVIARYEFVRKLNELSLKIGIELPKGASNKIVEAGKLILEKNNPQILKQYAKLHFKTTQEIIK